MRRLLAAFFLAFSFIFHVQAFVQTEERNDVSDSIRISLLTCAAGEEIYSLYGHTAIRYENFSKGIDIVYNYGVFDFDTPNFALRFALGQTDYQLGKNRFNRFAAAYAFSGRDVYQQVLNLTTDEKLHLVALLEENYRPEKRMYRYNFFYDNCATRPRDMIEQAINGSIHYAENAVSQDKKYSFRDLLHQYNKEHPWSRFGMDLCVGSEGDKPITFRQMMFVPFYVQDFFRTAHITNKEGNTRPLVLSEEKIVEAEEVYSPIGITPSQVGWIFFGFILIVTVHGVWKHQSWWGIDLILFTIAGIAGCILTFLALLSEHPAMSPNYLLFVFHPFHLLTLPWVMQNARRHQISWYLLANGTVLTLFIVLWNVIPQNFPPTVLPLALCLLIRSINNIIISRL